MEPELSNALQEYLRNQLNTNKIEYKEKPVLIPKGLGNDKYVFTLNNAPEHLTQPLLVRMRARDPWYAPAQPIYKKPRALYNPCTVLIIHKETILGHTRGE